MQEIVKEAHIENGKNQIYMGKINAHPLYYLGAITIIIVTLFWYYDGNKIVSVVATSVQSSNFNEPDQQYSANLAKVNPNCAQYYETGGQKPDSITSDFTNLHPLSDFLCGKYSLVNKKIQSDGKTLYLVAIVASTDCGSGGCTTQALLEEKPGQVLHIRSLSGFYDKNLNFIER